MDINKVDNYYRIIENAAWDYLYYRTSGDCISLDYAIIGQVEAAAIINEDVLGQLQVDARADYIDTLCRNLDNRLDAIDAVLRELANIRRDLDTGN